MPRSCVVQLHSPGRGILDLEVANTQESSQETDDHVEVGVVSSGRSGRFFISGGFGWAFSPAGGSQAWPRRSKGP